MTMVVLSQPDVQHLALCFNERRMRDVPEIRLDVERMRLLFIQAVVSAQEMSAFELSQPQLRLLDTLLTDADPRSGKLPDGRPITDLLSIVWSAMVVALKEESDARDEDDHAYRRSGPALDSAIY